MSDPTTTAVPDHDAVAAKLIRHLKRTPLIPGRRPQAADQDDVAQELALHAHLARATYDPARGTVGTYYDRILRNKLRTLREHATCQCRDVRRERPLHDAVDAVEEADHVDLRLDVRDALAALDPADRSIAHLFASSGNVADVARWTGSTRGQVRSARTRIARALRAKDLAPNPSSRQPIRRTTRYVLDDRSSYSPTSQPSVRHAEDVGCRSNGRPAGGGKGTP